MSLVPRPLPLMAFCIIALTLWGQVFQVSALPENGKAPTGGERYPTNPYEEYFNEAYERYPSIPVGVLEAVAWKMTRFRHLNGSTPKGCMQKPHNYGVMGLVLNGHGNFRENLRYVADMSSFSVAGIRQDPRKGILAYARAYREAQQELDVKGRAIKGQVPVLMSLSELPHEETLVNDYAMSSWLYDVLNTLGDRAFQKAYGLPRHKVDLAGIFGQKNLKVLRSSQVTVGKEEVHSKEGISFNKGPLRSPDYPPAIWDPVPSCNYSSRNGTPVSAVVIHTMQGTYSGAISWAHNCNSNVSFHYAIRSSDGQITQLVYEADNAWHVGSENSYTIGIEHEGYIDDPSYLTDALYRSSADLVRDITNSGYGIDPLRTHDGPACSGGSSNCELGSCTRIKGHQHYPNQTHTDPGPYYDWAYYYRLINNNPPVDSMTTNSGQFYDSGGPNGDYSNDERQLYLIQPPNDPPSVTLTIDEFELEADWDYLYVYDGNALTDSLIGKYTGTTIPSTISSSGSSILLEFRSDCQTTAPGWAISWRSAEPDTIDPVTRIDTNSFPQNGWVTGDFDVTFIDRDDSGGSGLEKRYYQVLDFDGKEWRGNHRNGFFSDNFGQDSIHSDWTVVNGDWKLTGSGVLRQSEDSLNNTNIYAPLDQGLSNRYLYHWEARIDGSGSNRRAGLHFFSDDPALNERGNSYFVWFRVDDDRVQIYDVNSNSWGVGPDLDKAHSFKAGEWYDFKVSYDRITGEMRVYVNDQLVAEWSDPTPHQGGSHISFRSGNADYRIRKLNVYRSRYPQVTVKIGPDTTNDVRHQNQGPDTSAGMIRSIVQDNEGNLSPVVSQDFDVDWTSPVPVAVNDGMGNDIDTTHEGTQLGGNWTRSNDRHSGLMGYEYAVGSSPGDSDVVAWTGVGMDTAATATGLNLIDGVTYYVVVRALNNAGLRSTPTSSNGQLYLQPIGIPENEDAVGIDLFPNPARTSFNLFYALPSSGEVRIELLDARGREITGLFEGRKNAGEHVLSYSVSELDISSGLYFIRLYKQGHEPFIKKLWVE